MELVSVVVKAKEAPKVKVHVEEEPEVVARVVATGKSWRRGTFPPAAWPGLLPAPESGVAGPEPLI